MQTDSHMQTVRKCINEIVDLCAAAAETGGPDAVRALRIQESAELPPGPGVKVSSEYAAQLALENR